jgi:hypothetical protein
MSLYQTASGVGVFAAAIAIWAANAATQEPGRTDHRCALHGRRRA